MKSVDVDFIPPIEEREGGIKKYLDGILGEEHYIYLLEDHLFHIFRPRIVGVLLTYQKRDKRVLKYLAIDRGYRGMGHGRSLLELSLLDNIKKIKRFVVRTWDTNKDALRLYRKLGFRHYWKRKDLKERKGEAESVYLEKEKKED